MRNGFLTTALLLVAISTFLTCITAPIARGDEASTGETAPKVTLITRGWLDIMSIMRQVARDVDFGLQMAPDAIGKTNVHLIDVPLPQALAAILKPAGMGFEIRDKIIVVYNNQLITRCLSFDYPVTERQGQGKLRISGSSQSGSGRNESSSSNYGDDGGGGGGGSGENESHVTSSVAMTVWPYVGQALQAMVFPGGEESGVTGTATPDGNMAIADVTGRSLIVNPMAGLIQITAEWDRLEQAENFIAKLQESIKRQVAIEVKILEVNFSKKEKSGVNWSTVQNLDDAAISTGLSAANSNTGTPYFSFIVETASTTSLLDAIAEQGNVNVLSSPRITTLNNQKAVVRVVTEEVYYMAEIEPAIVTNGVASEPITAYTPQVVSVGIVLDVTPQVGSDGQITLNVHPTLSNVVGIATSPNADTQPVISIRELDTVGKVNNGETLVIAGLISEGTIYKETGIPLLKDIPLLGLLFKNRSNEKTTKELVMLLTPVILTDDGITASASAAEESIRSKM